MLKYSIEKFAESWCVSLSVWLSSWQRDSVEQLCTKASLSEATKKTVKCKSKKSLMLHYLIWDPNPLGTRTSFIKAVTHFAAVDCSLFTSLSECDFCQLMGARVQHLEGRAGVFPSKPDVSSSNHKTWEIHVDVLYSHCWHWRGVTVIVSDRHSFTEISSHLICGKQSPKNVTLTASTCAVLLSRSIRVADAKMRICGNDICNWKQYASSKPWGILLLGELFGSVPF